ncbi:MAG: aldehyde dehydrogenase (NADP(+)) [Pseudomonadota bacterium]
MTELTGKHLINGRWVGSTSTFESVAIGAEALRVSERNSQDVDAAVLAADAVFARLSAMPPERHSALLCSIAAQIDVLGDEITASGTAETGLPEARLIAERGRTTGQLRLFAEYIKTRDHLDRRHDAAKPERKPLPSPDLRSVMRPVGPVAIFGASNFPLAFSTAGGDTASALAAGCPVIVKGHPAHPRTGEIVATAIAAAVASEGYPVATFQMIQGSTHDLGRAMVEHPLICAVGFTGSLGAGRALFDICAGRPTPIPFFGELGSINPVFILPNALSSRGTDIAKDWAASLTMGVGQFCTNPGLIVLPEGPEGDAFLASAVNVLGNVPSQTMLTEPIANGFAEGQRAVFSVSTPLVEGEHNGREVTPAVASVTAAEFAVRRSLTHEVFGPFGLVVRTKTSAEMLAIAAGLDGQLTCSLQLNEGDTALARELLPILERKAGRILANDFPTGVEVASAMIHGGPYPASTNFGHTSVGTMAIRRWLRPICLQGFPSYLEA